jgi:hypothetical protein
MSWSPTGSVTVSVSVCVLVSVTVSVTFRLPSSIVIDTDSCRASRSPLSAMLSASSDSRSGSTPDSGGRSASSSR